MRAWHTVRRRGRFAIDRLRRRGSRGLLMYYRPHLVPLLPPLPDGYALRSWRSGDDEEWCGLLNLNGQFGSWTVERLDRENRTLVREGQIFVVHDGRLVATTGVYDRPLRGRAAWEIGWVAAHPDHFGRGLGRHVVAAAVTAALAMEPRPVVLFTDDHRLPAITIYLALGFSPDLSSRRGDARRWEAIFRALAEYRGGMAGSA